MFAAIFICGNLFFADRRETAKIRTRKISPHTVYQTLRNNFSKPTIYFKLSIRAFFVFDLLFIFFWKVWALTLSFLSKNIFQAEMCEILRIWWWLYFFNLTVKSILFLYCKTSHQNEKRALTAMYTPQCMLKRKTQELEFIRFRIQRCLQAKIDI